MSTKHTGAPWSVSPHRSESNGYVLIDGQGWSEFAKVAVRLDSSPTDDPEGVANLRLVIAAPDMLAALEEVREWISNWDPAFIQDDDWPATRDRMNAAIAKAKGDA